MLDHDGQFLDRAVTISVRQRGRGVDEEVVIMVSSLQVQAHVLGLHCGKEALTMDTRCIFFSSLTTVSKVNVV